MKTFLLIIFTSFIIIAQQFKANDPYASSQIINEIKIKVDKYYPVFGNSEKPHSVERIFRLTDIDGIYTTFIHFNNNYNPPFYDTRAKILRLYYPESYYDYIKIRLDNDEAFLIFREYKDGHKWGEIYFNKYP